MEEIDAIIIESLCNLNCDLEEITSLKQFDADMVVAAVSACLESIVPGVVFQKKLPPSMSLKLKATSNLAQQIKDLGFREDIGYQTLLYCNETEIRRVLMFLIERLPRESKASHVEQTGYVPTLVKEIENKIKLSMQQFWVPSSFLKSGKRCVEDGYLINSFGDSGPLRTKRLKIPNTRLNNDDILKRYWSRNIPEVTKQCELRELIPSLLFDDCGLACDANYLNIVEVTKNRKQFDIERSSQSVELEGNIVEAVQELKISEDDGAVESILSELKTQKAEHNQLKESVNKLEAQLEEVNRTKCDEENALKEILAKINLKSKTLTIVSKEGNLSKLKNLIENSNNKLAHLAEQWNEIQSPLLEEYKSLQNSLSSEDLKLQEEQAKLKKLKDTYTSLTNDFKQKISLEEQLKKKVEQINKSHNRLGYTRRILEIIGNIKKQDEEIQKILKDTKDVQREINNLTGQVDRSFTLSDELIFRDAKQDETARKSYKLLAQLRDECSSIIKAVTDLGVVEREARNLQEQIDSETAKDMVVKLERVTKDLQEIKKENESFLKQL